ncbi:MAG: hypothetical protein ACYDEV_07505 [Acidiferrobacter sp.]
MSKKLTDLLDRPIAFHRALVPVVGGVLPALMLSQAIYWTKRTSDPDGWFWKTQAEWEKETGMGRREQETARARLRETLFWKEKLRDIPARMFFFIDMDLLMADLMGGCKQSSMADSAILERRKAPIRKGGKRQAGLAESAHLYTESTSKTTPETTAETTHASDPRVCVSPGGGDMVDRHQNSKSKKSKDGLQEGGLSEDQTALVEVTFQAAMEGGGIKNPAAYKTKLAHLAAAGELLPPAKSLDLCERNRIAAAPWAANLKGAGAGAEGAWDAYSLAYERRYGVPPVRNDRSDAQMRQLVSRLGAEAPAVAGWYPRHTNAFYVRAKHPVDLLLRDAEGLRTEWATGRITTNTEACQVDRKPAIFNAFAPLLAQAEAAQQE